MFLIRIREIQFCYFWTVLNIDILMSAIDKRSRFQKKERRQGDFFLSVIISRKSFFTDSHFSPSVKKTLNCREKMI